MMPKHNTIIVVEKGEGMKKLKSDYPDIKFDSLVKLEMIGDKVVILS